MNEINLKRRNVLKTVGALGGGYMLGRVFPKSKNEEKAILNTVGATAFANASDKPFYRSNQLYNINCPVLDKDGDYDVCIIGGGLTGLSTALHLMNQNHKVILLESGILAAKASGVNGGQVLNSYECDMEFFEDKFGTEIAKEFWQLSLDAVELVKSNIKQYTINCGWQSGTGVVAYKKEHMDVLKEEYEIRTQKYGYNKVKLLGEKQAQELTGSKIYYGLLYDEGNGHMNPLNYALRLAEAIKNSSNVEVYENSPVTKIEFNEDKPHLVVVNDKHQIKAKKVVLAANFGMDKFLPEFESSTMSMETFIMTTDPIAPEILKGIIPNRMALFDTRRVMNYFRLTENNGLLFGGGDVFGQFNIKNVEEALYRELLYTYPQLAGIKVHNFWQGTESFTMNLAPVIGKTKNDSVYYAKGFSGQGLALSNLTGKMFADAINGNSKHLDMFAKIKPWGLTSNKTIQKWTLQAGAYYYKFLDMFS